MASLCHHLICLLLLQLPLFISAQSNNNITLGSSLSSLNENPFWTSPSGEFAFGFHPHQKRFLLAIWFARIPARTIVWTANAGVPLKRGARVQLTSDGVLSLTSPNRTQIWSARAVDNSQITHAAILNTGNLILSSNDFSIAWSSFDNPTDTILPTQILQLGSQLSSRLTEEDYTIGRFVLSLEMDGNLEFRTVARPMSNYNAAYWSSDTSNNGTQLVFNQSGYIYLTRRSGGNYNLSSETPISTTDYYQRATLDFDGVLRKYTYPRTIPSYASWSTSWRWPRDICALSIRFGYGTGVCGFNSYCRLNEEQRPECECPSGYTYTNPNNLYGGCRQKFVPQSCDRNESNIAEGFAMREIPSTDWEGGDYKKFESVSKDWCSETCLNDCACTAASVRGGGCWLKGFPLTRGYLLPGAAVTALIKVGNSPNSISQGKKSSKNIVPIVVPTVIGALVLFVIAIFCCLRRKKEFEVVNDIGEVESLQFNLATIIAATDNFSDANRLGRGGFGAVYKGKLANGKQIAVKRLSRHSGQGVEEFKNEVVLLARVQHRNLVKLFGFCLEGGENLLIYEFVPNSSLDKFIFDSVNRTLLDWESRYKIIKGIARGLLYLHEDSHDRIIHRDLKASNVLLDAQMNPKISDFGMARLFVVDQTQGSTKRVVGTYGYMSPEYAMHGHFSVKSDVFSYGVLVLEIITGQKNSNFFDSERTEFLLSYAWRLWQDGTPLELLDPACKEHYSTNEVIRCIQMGLLCVQEDPAKRPTMASVTVTLSSDSVTLPLLSAPATGRTNSSEQMWKGRSGSSSTPCSVNEVTVTELDPR